MTVLSRSGAHPPRGARALPCIDCNVCAVDVEAGTGTEEGVVAKTKDGEVMAKELTRQNARKVELMSLNRTDPGRTLDLEEIDWISRTPE
jgi:phage repressor protein C with HTH and peptisase S24 domain